MTCKHLNFARKVVNRIIGNHGNIKGLKTIFYKKDLSRFIKNSFYKNAYSLWKKNKVYYEPCNFNIIKNDWIYDHILLTDDDGRVFKPPGYYTDDNMPHYVPKYFKDLPVQVPLRDLRGIFRTLIPNLNRAFHKIQYTNNEQDIFSLTRENEKIVITKGIFKVIYNCILESKINNTSKIWEQKWGVELNMPEDGLNWENIWKVVHNGIVNYKVQSSIWEMIHRNFICGYILKQMHKSDGVCKLCNKLERQRTHIFMNCDIINYVYNHFSNIITIFDNSVLSQKEKAFGIFEQMNDKKLLRNYTTFIIRHIIYRNRNMVVNRGVNVQLILINKVKQFIRNDLINRFDIAKFKNEVLSFKEKYLIDEVFGKIENNKLLLHI